MTNEQHSELVDKFRATIDGPMTPSRFDEHGWQIIDGNIHAPCGCVAKAPVSFIPATPGVFPSNENLLFAGFQDCGKAVDYHGGTGCVFCNKDRALSFAVGLPYNREVWAWYQEKTDATVTLQ